MKVLPKEIVDRKEQFRLGSWNAYNAHQLQENIH